MIDRRSFVGAGVMGALAMSLAPRLAFAKAETDKRFVFIIQRGAADGLGTVAPTGDPAFSGARGALAEDFAGATRLDTMFALHPSLGGIGKLYGQGQALFAHAVASPYRDRSHFDGQNVLETGGAGAYQVKDGWLNRMLGILPPTSARAIAISATVPMALRGGHEVSSYAPSALPDASAGLLDRVSMLYQGDSQLHALWSEAMATRALTNGMTNDDGRNAAATGALAAKLLVPENGARIAMIETNGWDTHNDNFERIKTLAGGVDRGYAALIADLRDRGMLDRTMVLWMGEFGRTPRINGRTGRDHYPRVFNLAISGGGVKGGQVIGSSTDDGSRVKDRPVKVEDLFSSVCYALDVDTDKEHNSPLGRPLKIVDGGETVTELFS